MAVELSPDDALVVLELQEADIAHFFASSKGKSAKPTDEDEAFSLYRDELARLAQVYEDDKIARSIAAAVTTDAPVLEKLLEEERRAREDHRLAQLRRPRVDVDCRTILLDVRAILAEADSDVRHLHGMDDFKLSESIPVYCRLNHRYCRDCLRDLFLAAAKDESLFPPRCDGSVIPISLVEPYLSHDALANYYARMRECTTVDRLYCSTSTCSTFLGPAQPVRLAVECSKCHNSTCAACKAPWHGPFGLCGASADDEAADVLERDHQCKRCPRCKRIISLDTGCWHV